MSSTSPSEHAPSYYAATCNDLRYRAPLETSAEADVCVVGAGFSGLATALHLAERGLRVIVLEARRIGWGASGRNGGQLVNGYSRDLDVIERRYGRAAADALGGMAFEGGAIIRDWIARYAIDCDYREGGVAAALNRRQLAALEALVPAWERHGHSGLELLDERSIRHHVNTDLYVGGLLDRWGGHVHPLNLALGEAGLIESLGGRIHEDSPVVRVTGGERPEVLTSQGVVRAGQVVLCGNAYLGATVPALRDKVMPVATQVIATEPLGEATGRRLMPSGACVEDCNYMLDYYRMTADHRLLFGGGTVYGGREPGDIGARLRPHVRRTFPELGDVRFDYAWSGNFALTLTRIPHLGRLPDGVWFTHGYSGHGVTTTHLAGRLLAEAITGETARFEAFARLRNVPFPGGRLLRVPLTALGAWYYRVRDRPTRNPNNGSIRSKSPMPHPKGDQAFRNTDPHDRWPEMTYGGALSFLRRRYTRDLRGVDVAVTGIPLDSATSYRPGARLGPAAVRAASVQLAELPAFPWGFDPFERLAVVDYGDCFLDFGQPEAIPGAIAAHARGILEAGVRLLALGGDHFASYPLLRAHAERHGPVALLQFDAHPDTWPDDGRRLDHGTMFRRAADDGLIDVAHSVQIGIRTHAEPMGFTVLDAPWVHDAGPRETIRRVRDALGERPVYLTFDIDCLDPAFAPGTGTPVPGGLSSAQALAILRGLGGVDFVGMDVVEVAPPYDSGHITALAAAHLAHDWLCLLASRR